MFPDYRQLSLPRWAPHQLELRLDDDADDDERRREREMLDELLGDENELNCPFCGLDAHPVCLDGTIVWETD